MIERSIKTVKKKGRKIVLATKANLDAMPHLKITDRRFHNVLEFKFKSVMLFMRLAVPSLSFLANKSESYTLADKQRLKKR